jgi:hypothetical protein
VHEGAEETKRRFWLGGEGRGTKRAQERKREGQRDASRHSAKLIHKQPPSRYIRIAGTEMGFSPILFRRVEQGEFYV